MSDIDGGEPEFSREEYVYLAKLYDRAERYEEMVEFCHCFIKMKPNLKLEERVIFTAAYKNLISPLRQSWRHLHFLQKKEFKSKKLNNATYIREVLEKLESDLTDIILSIQSVIDSFLLPNAKNIEYKVYYLKMKGDYYRYLAEFTMGKEKENAINDAEKFYSDAYLLSESQLAITSTTKIGLALNFSVFYYEIKESREEASLIARKAFDESIKVLEELEKNKAKDAILLIQILKENLILWNNELNEDEEI